MVQAVRGMRDVLPQEARRWRDVENAVTRVMRSFAYEEIQLPLLEFTELFARGVGEATDIVEKEMYSLNDRDGDSLDFEHVGAHELLAHHTTLDASVCGIEEAAFASRQVNT